MQGRTVVVWSDGETHAIVTDESTDRAVALAEAIE